MLIAVLSIVLLLWLRRLWVTRRSRKAASRDIAPSSGSECEADLLESGLSGELRGRKRVHLTSEATSIHPQLLNCVGDTTCHPPNTVANAACLPLSVKSVSSRPMSPTELLSVTKALQMELQSASSNCLKQPPKNRKKASLPFIGEVAARRARSRDFFTAVDTASWQPPLLANERPLFPTSKISKQSMRIPNRPRLLRVRAQDMFAANLINEIDTEDDAWAQSGRDPAKDPRWWTVGIVRAVSRADLADYFNQQDVRFLIRCQIEQVYAV